MSAAGSGARQTLRKKPSQHRLVAQVAPLSADAQMSLSWVAKYRWVLEALGPSWPVTSVTCSAA